MTISTYSDISSYVNNILEDAIFVLEERAVMVPLVTPMSATGMAARLIPKYSQSTAVEGAEGVDLAGTAEFNKTTADTITPKYVKSQYRFTGSRFATDPDSTRNDAARNLGFATTRKIDEDLLGEFANFTTGKGTAGSSLTLTHVGAAMAVLNNNNAIPPFSVVLHPYGWHDIWVAMGQPGANQALLGDVANQALRDYFVMRHLGATWYTDGNISVDGSDDAISGVFTRDAIVFDNRQDPMMLVDFDASAFGGGLYELNMETWYGTGMPRPEAGVKLTHDATEPT